MDIIIIVIIIIKTTIILIKHVDICTMCINHVDIWETSPFFQAMDWQLNDD